jgi:hypothetical protein
LLSLESKRPLELSGRFVIGRFRGRACPADRLQA